MRRQKDTSDLESAAICSVVWIYQLSGRRTHFISGNFTLLKHRESGQVSAMHVSFFYKIWASLVFVEVIGIFGIDFKMNSPWVPSREGKGKGILPLTQSTVQIKCCELQGCTS